MCCRRTNGKVLAVCFLKDISCEFTCPIIEIMYVEYIETESATEEQGEVKIPVSEFMWWTS